MMSVLLKALFLIFISIHMQEFITIFLQTYLWLYTNLSGNVVSGSVSLDICPGYSVCSAWARHTNTLMVIILYWKQAFLQSKMKICLSDVSCLPSSILAKKKGTLFFFFKVCNTGRRTVMLRGKNCNSKLLTHVAKTGIVSFRWIYSQIWFSFNNNNKP